jgi:prepilin-type processing-associated H-X9-DG protein
MIEKSTYPGIADKSRFYLCPEDNIKRDDGDKYYIKTYAINSNCGRIYAPSPGAPYGIADLYGGSLRTSNVLAPNRTIGIAPYAYNGQYLGSGFGAGFMSGSWTFEYMESHGYKPGLHGRYRFNLFYLDGHTKTQDVRTMSGDYFWGDWSVDPDD